MTKTKTQHAPSKPTIIKAKIKEVGKSHFLSEPPANVAVNAPKALMQTHGEGFISGLLWVERQPLYAAAPDLLKAAILSVRSLEQGAAPSWALDTLRAAIAKAEGR